MFFEVSKYLEENVFFFLHFTVSDANTFLGQKNNEEEENQYKHNRVPAHLVLGPLNMIIKCAILDLPTTTKKSCERNVKSFYGKTSM